MSEAMPCTEQKKGDDERTDVLVFKTLMMDERHPAAEGERKEEEPGGGRTSKHREAALNICTDPHPFVMIR